MRKTKAKKRPLLPDPKFNDQLVTRFVNNLMLDGKKSIAFKIFYDALDIVETKKGETEKTALEIWKDALTNVMPHVEVRSRRLIKYSKARNDKSMALKLANEVVAASREEGAAYKKKTDTHKMAEANKAFSHFKF
jgi:small subunit ribosomal protein S7